ncbi:10103_t:CDS:1, partial [Dentiscutata heterogama]
QNTKKKRAANEAEIYKNKNIDKKPKYTRTSKRPNRYYNDDKKNNFTTRSKSNLATQPHEIKSLYNRVENSKPLLVTNTENIKMEKADSQDTMA